MENTNDRRQTKVYVWRVLFTLVLVAWVAFIFSNSLQIGSVSSGVSGRVLAIIKTALKNIGWENAANRITEHLVRKLGHYCEYTLEGFILMMCVRVYTSRYMRYLSWPMLGGLLTGLADETIQLSTSGRSSLVTDVWIDFAGVLSGMIAGLLVLAICHAIAARLGSRRGTTQ